MKRGFWVMMWMFFSIITSCRTDKPEKYQAPLLEKKYRWEQADFERFLHSMQVPDSLFDTYTRLINFDSLKQCDGYYVVVPAPDFAPTSAELEAIKVQLNDFSKLYNVCSYLYSTIPELYFDHVSVGNFSSKKNTDVVQLIEWAKKGRLVASCQTYAQLTQQVCQHLLPQNKAVVVIKNLSESTRYPIAHWVAIVYIKGEDGIKAMVLDAMYGYLFPVGSGAQLLNMDTIKQIALHNTFHQYDLHFMDDSVLIKKRFLTNKVWPCNLVQDEVANYYFAPPGALSKLELHEQEKIEYLDVPHYNKEKFRTELIHQIIENEPLF